jgi:hypothetical protein
VRDLARRVIEEIADALAGGRDTCSCQHECISL